MEFIAKINIMPLKSLLDPQGKAVGSNMNNIGLSEIKEVRVGKHITLNIAASNKEEAETKFMDQGGINHDMINQTLGTTGADVENYYADANYTDSENAEYIGKVAYDPWDDDSKENEDIDITDYYNEEDDPDADSEYQQERANHIAKSQARGEW